MNDELFQPVRKGLLETAVLSVVSAHEVYAADLLQKLDSTSFATSEGTLYPLLSRLCREGLLAYSWTESASGPPRKYYKLTPAGQKRLSEARKYLHSLSGTLDHLGENHG
jgi:PadR family transcriptional regulator PadR